MNAYELADKVDFEPYGTYGEQAANMLRQQADRIKDLEKLLEHSVGADCREMRYIQEIENRDARIAELEKGGEVAGRFYWESVVDGHVMAVPSEGTPHYNKDDFPLYTTPQIKELSNEEIERIYYKTLNRFDFARAILKKASEK